MGNKSSRPTERQRANNNLHEPNIPEPRARTETENEVNVQQPPTPTHEQHQRRPPEEMSLLEGMFESLKPKKKAPPSPQPQEPRRVRKVILTIDEGHYPVHRRKIAGNASTHVSGAPASVKGATIAKTPTTTPIAGGGGGRRSKPPGQRFAKSDSSARLAYEQQIKDVHSMFIPRKVRSEPWYRIHCEVAIPFLIAGIGMVVAGWLLDLFSCDPAFVNLRELIVLITPLLGLKGNLEMTMTARLCTHVNLGHLDTVKKKLQAWLEDMRLSLVQSTVCGLLAGAIAIIVVAIEGADSNANGFPLFDKLMIILTISIVTGCCASVIIGTLLIALIFAVDKLNLNPDNVGTPFAACLGDVLTLVLLRGWAILFYKCLDSSDGHLLPIWVPILILLILIGLMFPILLWFTLKHEVSKRLLKECWIPVIAGIVISSAAGSILEKEGKKYFNMNLYQPVINGAGGNLASVQFCRISTAYSRDSTLGSLPKLSNGAENKVCNTPAEAACFHGQQTISLWVLLSVVIPGQINFAMLTYFLAPTHIPDCFEIFMIGYLLACVIQVIFLMYITLTITNFLWKRKYQPESYVIPIVTALGDLIGTLLLFALCYIVYDIIDACSNGVNSSGNVAHLHCRK